MISTGIRSKTGFLSIGYERKDRGMNPLCNVFSQFKGRDSDRGKQKDISKAVVYQKEFSFR